MRPPAALVHGVRERRGNGELYHRAISPLPCFGVKWTNRAAPRQAVVLR
jgi:hypothetical protein